MAPVAVAVMRISAGALGALAAADAQGATSSQPEKKSAATKGATPKDTVTTKPPAIDPTVIEALDRMGTYLREQQEFSVRAETTTDGILESGQKVQFEGNVDMWVSRPNRLRMDITGDQVHRLLFYDGKTFTQYGPDKGYYASFAAPPTINELIERAQERFGIELPLADLFYWGTPKSGLNDVLTAVDLGPANVDGVACEHYALHQKDVDWQIWVADGNIVVPRKLIVTTLRETSQPQHTAVLSWNLRPNLHDSAFTFEPPKGAKPIVFEVVGVSFPKGAPP